jgi:hypothetical protein
LEFIADFFGVFFDPKKTYLRSILGISTFDRRIVGCNFSKKTASHRNKKLYLIRNMVVKIGKIRLFTDVRE